MSKLSLALGLCTGLLTVPAFAQTPQDAHKVALKYAKFDPATQPIDVPAMLRGGDDTRLWIVQFQALPTDGMRDAVRANGATIHSYLPDHAYVVRMPVGAAFAVQQQHDVRSVSPYHPAFRLETQLRVELQDGSAPKRRYNIVVVDKHNDKPGLAQKITAIGGAIDSMNPGSLLLEATLTGAQLAQVARLDQVLWIDRWGAPEDDMDNARVQGGADYVENQTGYTGQGIVGHQMEGLDPNHVDWSLTPIGHPAGCTSSSSHGHNTAGIVYGNGSSSSLARGMAPSAQSIFTSCRTNRYANFQSLISTHQIMFTTASWGSPRTFFYTSVSAEADDICFDQDIAWTNSQSNAGNQDSRAEAWAKNVFACGGIHHANNSNPNDDSWQNGSASIGPAADGRTKPDFCAYYDNIATSSIGGGFTSGFGGTSGATPIVAGHNAIAIQMFTNGDFGNTLRNPGGSRFSNKPKFPTLKALQMVCTDQYPFTGASVDNRREHQGYGFPSLRNMWDDRNVMFIVDEEDIIQQGQGCSYVISVPGGRNELNISMSFADPAGNPAASLARINDLTLRVISPGGTVYWGNDGLTQGVWNQTGGDRDRINTAENVYVQNPQAGNWTVDVIAYEIVQDGHVETGAMDADYGLVVRGGTLVSKSNINVAVGSITKFGTSCVGTGVAQAYCASNNVNGGTLTQETRQWEYAYQATASQALTVTGFELFTASVGGGTINSPAAIYLDSGSGPQDPPLATTTLTVDGAQAFYSASFVPPVNIPNGATFYVSTTHNNSTYVSTLSSGSSSPAYYRDGTGWNPSGLATEPAFRVLCQGGGGPAAPILDVTGTSEIGQVLTADLSQAAPSTVAAMFVGISDTFWIAAGLPLPADLTLFGAPSCNLYVSGELSFGFGTDANGNGQLPLPIPGDTNLIGANFFLQAIVFDPAANTLGFVFTEAYSTVFGG